MIQAMLHNGSSEKYAGSPAGGRGADVEVAYDEVCFVCRRLRSTTTIQFEHRAVHVAVHAWDRPSVVPEQLDGAFNRVVDASLGSC